MPKQITIQLPENIELSQDGDYTFGQLDNDVVLGINHAVLPSTITNVGVRRVQGVGVNIRAFLYAGTPQFPYYSRADREASLALLKAMGMRYVRFFVPHVDYDTEAIIDKMHAGLDLLTSYDLEGVPVLIDSLGVSGHTFKAYQQYHRHDWGHLDKSWFDHAYHYPYLGFVEKVVAEFGDGVGMWQLGNEFGIRPQPCTSLDEDSFIRFARTTAQIIREHAPHTPISLGLADTAHVLKGGNNDYDKAIDFYRQIPLADVVSCHIYNRRGYAVEEYPERVANDYRAAKALKRQFAFTEIGSDLGTNRPVFESAVLGHYPADMVLRWGYMPTTSDTGISDDRGWRRDYSDFGQLQHLYQQYIRS